MLKNKNELPTHDGLKKSSKQFFIALNDLQKILFACYINRDYPERRYYYDKKIHRARTALLTAMQHCRAAKTSDQWITRFENLYENLFSINNLKLRINDHTTFAVCEIEFRKLTELIGEVLHAYSHGNFQVTTLLDQFDQSIQQFEEINRATLQVIAPDPVIFLFFIQSLKAIHAEMVSIV